MYQRPGCSRKKEREVPREGVQIQIRVKWGGEPKKDGPIMSGRRGSNAAQKKKKKRKNRVGKRGITLLLDGIYTKQRKGCKGCGNLMETHYLKLKK